jgi:hypothetical protein
METAPQKEHRWLHKLVGEWTSEAEAKMDPGKPPERFKGTETVRSLGGLWILAEGEGDMPGCGPATTLMTLGYDPVTKRYRGTFVGSMMTHLWVYEGTLDAAEKVLTLDTEGPGIADQGVMVRYRDVITLESDDHRILESHLRGDDGTWQPFMTAHYRRKR